MVVLVSVLGFCLSSASNRYIFPSVHSTSMTIGGVSICGVAMNLFIAGHELGAAGTSSPFIHCWSSWTVVVWSSWAVDVARTRRGRCETASAELEIDLGRAGDLKHSTHAVAIWMHSCSCDAECFHYFATRPPFRQRVTLARACNPHLSC